MYRPFLDKQEVAVAGTEGGRESSGIRSTHGGAASTEYFQAPSCFSKSHRSFQRLSRFSLSSCYLTLVHHVALPPAHMNTYNVVSPALVLLQQAFDAPSGRRDHSRFIDEETGMPRWFAQHRRSVMEAALFAGRDKVSRPSKSCTTPVGTHHGLRSDSTHRGQREERRVPNGGQDVLTSACCHYRSDR